MLFCFRGWCVEFGSRVTHLDEVWAVVVGCHHLAVEEKLLPDVGRAVDDKSADLPSPIIIISIQLERGEGVTDVHTSPEKGSSSTGYRAGG